MAERAKTRTEARRPESLKAGKLHGGNEGFQR